MQKNERIAEMGEIGCGDVELEEMVRRGYIHLVKELVEAYMIYQSTWTTC